MESNPNSKDLMTNKPRVFVRIEANGIKKRATTNLTHFLGTIDSKIVVKKRGTLLFKIS